jgi:very-short-patch-repair endonuclease
MLTPVAKQLAKEQAKAKREYLEMTFQMQLIAGKVKRIWKREYTFHPTRKWRFDFAFEDIKLAIEINGATKYGKSRHSYGDGIQNDFDKTNAAQAMGWTVFSFTTDMVISGQAILFVQDFINAKGDA